MILSSSSFHKVDYVEIGGPQESSGHKWVKVIIHDKDGIAHDITLHGAGSETPAVRIAGYTLSTEGEK